jgi:DNA polymerase elongation subunit (family B)
LNYDELQRNIVGYLRGNQAWSRAISLDIEADLKTLDNPSKIILSLSLARRNGNEIEITNFIVDEETEEQETSTIIGDFGAYCERLRPLVLIGYGITKFDLPVLILKMKRLDCKFKREKIHVLVLGI